MPPRLALGMPGALAGLSTRGMSLRGRRLKGTGTPGKPAVKQLRQPVPAPVADEDLVDKDLDTVADLRDEDLATAHQDMADADGIDLEAADGDEAAVDGAVADDGDVVAVDDLAEEDLPVDDLPVEVLPVAMDLAVDGSLSPPLVAAGSSRPADANVDSLIAELEAGPRSAGRAATRGSARRQLEELLERKRVARELEDFEDFEI